MQKALHLRATVQPGGKIEIIDRQLPVGKSVEVVVWPSPEKSSQSAYQIISKTPGSLLFKTAKEVDVYIREERSCWNN